MDPKQLCVLKPVWESICIDVGVESVVDGWKLVGGELERDDGGTSSQALRRVMSWLRFGCSLS